MSIKTVQPYSIIKFRDYADRESIGIAVAQHKSYSNTWKVLILYSQNQNRAIGIFWRVYQSEMLNITSKEILKLPPEKYRILLNNLKNNKTAMRVFNRVFGKPKRKSNAKKVC